MPPMPLLRLCLVLLGITAGLMSCSHNAQTTDQRSEQVSKNVEQEDSKLLLVVGRRVAPAADEGLLDQAIINNFPEARWLRADSDVIRQLNSQPAECIHTPSGEEQRQQLNLGRVAFRNPALLGSAARELGLSCNSCHRNGHDNPRFFIEGLSAQPGTVDISSTRFAHTRDDALFNPLPIPDLTEKVLDSSTLSRYIRTVIEEDFAGPEPLPEVLEALHVYVTALNEEACPAPTFIERNLQSDLAEFDRELALLRRAVSADDKALIAFLVSGAQQRLNDIYRRYRHLSNTDLPASLNTLSNGLSDLNRLWFTPTDNLLFLNSWENWFKQLRPTLIHEEARSYYRL